MTKLKYHHIGIPTNKQLPKEDYIPHLKVTATGYLDSEYGVEWLNFDEDNTTPELVKTVPHVAFVVDNMEEALEGKNVIIKPNDPSDGIVVAFIEENGAPVEFLQFLTPESEVWPQNARFK